MRVRQRQAAARQFVAERHRVNKCSEEDAVFKPGEVVYRKGQPCTVVAVGYDTCPPHIVVRTSDGNEVGTEPSYLERLLPASPRRPLALTGKRSARADVRDIRPLAPAAPGAEEVIVVSSADTSSERHAALARMRNRRAERAAEAARERDYTLAELLDDRHERSSEAQKPRAPPAQAKKSPASRPVLSKQPPAAQRCCEKSEKTEVPERASPVANSPEMEAVSTRSSLSDNTPPALNVAADACMAEACSELVVCDEVAPALAGDSSGGLVLVSPLLSAPETDFPSRVREERTSPDGVADVNSELAAEVAAEAAFEAMQDFSSSSLSVLLPVSGAFSDAEAEDESHECREAMHLGPPPRVSSSAGVEQDRTHEQAPAELPNRGLRQVMDETPDDRNLDSLLGISECDF